MSKYLVQYVSSKGVASEIETLDNGHIHNAAAKLERTLASPGYDGDSERDNAVLSALKAEIAERAANAPDAQDPGAESEPEEVREPLTDAFDPDGL